MKLLDPLRPFVTEEGLPDFWTFTTSLKGEIGNGVRFLVTVDRHGQIEATLTLASIVAPSDAQAAEFFELWGLRPFYAVGIASRCIRHYIVLPGSQHSSAAPAGRVSCDTKE